MRLWSIDVSILTGNQKLYALWHECLQYPNDKDMKRLSLRKVIPRRISNVVKPPPYVLQVFSIAHKREWKIKGGVSKDIDEVDMDPGDRTSFNQIVSKQVQLITQVSGKLTNRRFYG